MKYESQNKTLNLFTVAEVYVKKTRVYSHIFLLKLSSYRSLPGENLNETRSMYINTNKKQILATLNLFQAIESAISYFTDGKPLPPFDFESSDKLLRKN